jgi:ATP-binding cassette subfamily B protein/subfamily B ATP-binding cassette protein MsbA
MKNFVRALRHALPYRRRLLCSCVAALIAAVLWGLNFTSIYPVLKLLHTGKSLHTWIDECIATTQKDVESFQLRVAEREKKLEDLDGLPNDNGVARQKRNLSNELLRLETKLQGYRSSIYWYQVLRRWIYALLPDDCFRTLACVTALVIIGITIKCFFEFVQESLVGSVVQLSLFDLRNRFYRRVIHLDVAQFGDQGTTELMARFTNDMESLGAGMKMLFGKVIAEPLRVIVCVTIACFISWQLTFLFLILVPIAALILVRIGRIMKQATRKVLERMSSIYKILQESFQGIRVVKAFTMEPYERRRFCAATRDYYYRAMKVINIEALSDPIIEVLGVSAVALALLAGSYLVLSGHTHLFSLQLASRPMEAESMLQLYILLAAIADPVRKLSSVFTRLQSGSAAADRIFAFVDRLPRIRPNTEGPRLSRPAWLPARAGEEPREQVLPAKPNYIEFRDVCFSYEPGKPILSHINLAVRAGETIAVVGPNGCGKTTLVGLVPRFWDPDHGSVFIDGLDLRNVHLRSLRQQIGLVTQETFLFDDTVYNNIAYGTRGATLEEVEAAARKAYAHDFIAEMPLGYQASVGESGCKLSGGQKQRLALARAILRNPSILILDEFTNQSDNESDLEIHRALKEFKPGRTVFLIAHKLHTLEIADRIIVLEQGGITAMGSHAELMVSCPLYQRLHEAQNQRRCA